MAYLPESEFNLVLLTYLKDVWVDQAISLCRKNKYKLTEIQFNKLCKSDSDPSWAAYTMVVYKLADLKWAMKVIESDKTGNPSETAYLLVSYIDADSGWARKVIENDISGNPSWAAYHMARNKHADFKWAKKVIENDRIGNPSLVSYQMVKNGHADEDWYEKVTGRNFNDVST